MVNQHMVFTWFLSGRSLFILDLFLHSEWLESVFVIKMIHEANVQPLIYCRRLFAPKPDSLRARLKYNGIARSQ